mmetsp:Transcript_51588/g.81926  ORF Transcript_51588/g.81926 Transcript_51588/m.81926 type:complete len:350 (-) Transcript_51588:28-1077(-)
MSTPSELLVSLVAVFSCLTVVASLKKDECGDDEASMVQTHTSMLRKTSALSLASTQRFRSVVIPYAAYAVDGSDITNLPEEYSLGQLFAYSPTTPVNSDLFVFFPGSWSYCANYTQLLEAIAPTMLTLCLPYDNVRKISDVCGSNSKCWYQMRLESYNGSFDGVAGNSLIARLLSALKYLKREHGQEWASYLETSGLKLQSMRFAGHSQGAGHAAMMGYQNRVARVVQFSGPCDVSSWFKTLTPATPVERFFAFASMYDQICPCESTQVQHWIEEGIASESKPITWVAEGNLSSFDPATSQTVISGIIPPVCKSSLCSQAAHDSTAFNKWAPPAVAPYASGLWQSLVGV